LLIDKNNREYCLKYTPEHSELRNNQGQILLRSSYSPLDRFEDPDFSAIWLSPVSRKVETIEFPRMGLSFTIKNDRAECDQLPGYQIAPSQSLSPLKGASHYLVLEKGAKQRVLVARLPFQWTRSSLDPNMEVERRGEENSIRVLQYDVSEDKRELLPLDDEARFYLAELYLRQLRYDRAFKMLKQNQGTKKAFTEAEIKALSSIVDLERSNGDADPRAAAIRLRAGYILMKNNIDFCPSRTESVFAIDSLCRRYKAVEEQIPP